MHARSGDKGGDANIGVWARDAAARPDRVAWLLDFLTADRVRTLLPETADLDVEVFALPNLGAVNVRGARPARRGRRGVVAVRPAGQGARRVAARRGTSTSRRPCCDAGPVLDRRAGRAAWTRRGRSCAPRSCRTCRSGRTPARCRATCTAQAARLGFLGLGVPEEVGGAGGTFLDALAVTEAFTEAGASSRLLAALFTSGIALPHLVASGDADLVDRFVRPTLAGETIGSLAITEPGGGSDVAGLRTTARRDGDEYVVNGSKTFITSGVRADFVTTAVRTGGPGHRGISLLVVEKRHARLHRRPVAGEDGLALLGHRRARVRRRAGAGREPGRRGEHRLRADRPGRS